MVYDINDDSSFNDIKNMWINEVEQYCKNEIKIFVLCNKCDSGNQSMKTVHKTFLDQKKICYYLVSAKTGKGVEEALMDIGKKMIRIVPKLLEKTLSM